MNEMRERLIDLLIENRIEIERDKAFIFADKLIKAGVILPKFKIGDTVWVIFDFAIRNRFVGWLKEERDMYSGKIISDTVAHINCNVYENEKTADVFHTKFFQLTFSEREIGKMYFFTEQEARDALKEEK